MKHGTLVLPADRARAFIELLGSKAHIQFLDMNANTMYRQYKRYVQRIEEMERILRFVYRMKRFFNLVVFLRCFSELFL